jgi:hypothetical protein
MFIEVALSILHKVLHVATFHGELLPVRFVTKTKDTVQTLKTHLYLLYLLCIVTNIPSPILYLV